MRMNLAGGAGDLYPLSLNLIDGVPFIPATYIEQGYTDIDILCIGAAGGVGGIYYSPEDDIVYHIIAGGGGGGGGGAHLVHTLLSSLPDEIEVIVGLFDDTGGAYSDDLEEVTSGNDGGYSSFGDPICRASGGKGGPAAAPEIYYGISGTDGGQGGIGDSVVAGGGASGAIAYHDIEIVASQPLTQNSGSDGTWDGIVGQGGGGGAGGLVNQDGTRITDASSGGRGAYRFDDTSFYAPGGSAYTPEDIYAEVPVDVIPTYPILGGFGGGAKTIELTHLLNMYGSNASGASPHGAVIVRLTRV